MLQYKLIMIFSHRHISFSQNKEMNFGQTIKQVTTELPLISICQQNTFLTYTIQKILTLQSIPYKLSKISSNQLQDGTKVINHKVPIFVFCNQILQKYQILQFLSDLVFGDPSLIFQEDNEYQYLEFVNRKSNFTRLAIVWGGILQFQKDERRGGFSMLSDVGVKTQEDYQNFVIQELQNLSINFKNGLLSKSFSGYSDKKATLQNVLFVDIIDSLERDATNSIPYYYLKAYYEDLLDLRNSFSKIIDETVPIQRHHKAEIIIDQSIVEDRMERPLINENWQRFMVVFGITSLIYAIFVRPK